MVHRVADGRYRADIDDAWTLRPLPHGGFVTVLALRAMTDALDHAEQQLRTLHTTFVAPVTEGPVDIEVEVLRRGRSMSQVRAEVRNPGAERGHLTTAIFGGVRRGFSFTDLEPPADVAPPSEQPSFRDPPPEGVDTFPPMRFWDEVIEGRAGIGHPPWEDYVPDRAVRAAWYRFDEPPSLDDGTIDPLSLVVMADTMPGAVGEKVGNDDRDWWAPSADLTVHLLQPCLSSWVLCHNTARFAGDGYASIDGALWDCGEQGTDSPRLVAYATQVCLFSFAP